MNEHIDMKISGSSTMPGGEYGSVSISGAGNEIVKVSGSLHQIGDAVQGTFNPTTKTFTAST